MRATVHEDSSCRRPSSADTRRVGTEIDSPDLSESGRLAPCCAFGLGECFAPLVMAPVEAHERWEGRCEFRAWTGVFGTYSVLYHDGPCCLRAGKFRASSNPS